MRQVSAGGSGPGRNGVTRGRASQPRPAAGDQPARSPSRTGRSLQGPTSARPMCTPSRTPSPNEVDSDGIGGGVVGLDVPSSVIEAAMVTIVSEKDKRALIDKRSTEITCLKDTVYELRLQLQDKTDMMDIMREQVQLLSGIMEKKRDSHHCGEDESPTNSAVLQTQCVPEPSETQQIVVATELAVSRRGSPDPHHGLDSSRSLSTPHLPRPRTDAGRRLPSGSPSPPSSSMMPQSPSQQTHVVRPVPTPRSTLLASASRVFSPGLGGYMHQQLTNYDAIPGSVLAGSRFRDGRSPVTRHEVRCDLRSTLRHGSPPVLAHPVSSGSPKGSFRGLSPTLQPTGGLAAPPSVVAASAAFVSRFSAENTRLVASSLRPLGR